MVSIPNDVDKACVNAHIIFSGEDGRSVYAIRFMMIWQCIIIRFVQHC